MKNQKKLSTHKKNITTSNSGNGLIFYIGFMFVVFVLIPNVCYLLYDNTEDYTTYNIIYSYPVSENFTHPIVTRSVSPLNLISYDELETFVVDDQTNLNIYTDTYMCKDFSDDVILNARAQGYTAECIFLEQYTDETTFITYGHAIVCFETSDEGTYFLEPQLDVLFSEAEMEDMLSAQLYEISNSNGEYFSEQFIDYYTV